MGPAAEMKRSFGSCCNAPDDARAGSALAALGRDTFDAADIAAMERAANPNISMDDRVSLGFSLAAVRGQRTFRRCLRLQALIHCAHARAVERGGALNAVDICRAFARRRRRPPRRFRQRRFSSSVARSGSTLTEQILAAHPNGCRATSAPICRHDRRRK